MRVSFRGFEIRLTFANWESADTGVDKLCNHKYVCFVPAYLLFFLFVLETNNNSSVDTLRLRQNGCHFADDTFIRIFLNENIRISIKILLKFVSTGPINNIPALVQIMAWCRPGDKPLSEPMMVRIAMHICVTRLQWVTRGPVSI